jgi:hypothetical protein
VTLKRSAMKPGKPLERKTPLRASSAQPKPPKGPKPKKCANRACRASYVPDPKQPFRNWCGPDCGTSIALAKLAKQKAAKAKAERAEDKRRKEEGMSHKERLEAVQKLANRIAVLRDWNDGCISCDKGAKLAGRRVAWLALQERRKQLGLEVQSLQHIKILLSVQLAQSRRNR